MSDEPVTASGPSASGKRRARTTGQDKNPYYILASSPQADERGRVLKYGDTFAVFDHYGDIRPAGLAEEGIYHEGTRFLSCMVLALGKDRPLFLSSTVKEDNDLLAVDLTNPDVASGGRVTIPRGTLHVARLKFLKDGVCYERLRVRNYGIAPVEASFTFHFEADFADIFEVRGTRRKKRGEYLDGIAETNVAVLAYRGLDGVVRRTRLLFDPRPASLTEEEASFHVNLRPQEETMLDVAVACERDGATPRVVPFDAALAKEVGAAAKTRKSACGVHTSSEPFNDLVKRTTADLHMMTTQTEYGPYPYAGVPWFSTQFGRDGIITALECLWLHPGLARGVLAYLAATQATETMPDQDAEPGKIMHETRLGEMAALKEIPFGRYYGSVDATPLFVMLAGAYHERTADRAFLAELWPHVEAALDWCDKHGDRDRDGFVEYYRQSSTGLVQQGWKDSHDSIFHTDGGLAQGPIALCEVQGYVFAAKRAASGLAVALGRDKQAEQLATQAVALQEKFERAFWCDDLSTYALALDGDKRPCRVRTSNAGHCLFTGIASHERARRVAATLMSPDSWSNWGVRTLSALEMRYNPMSYHNGSVWPHDNALIAHGFARYGLKEPAVEVLRGMFDASLFLDLHRLPELFCGFERRPGEGPTLYPVACAPQSWSAASVFLLLQACLGIRISSEPPLIEFSYPLLPDFLEEVHINNLHVGAATVDLLLLRHGQDVGINVPRREGRVEITMVK